MSRQAIETKLCRGHSSPILKCIGEVKITDYYDSWSDFEGEKISYCKNCCNKIFKYYIDNNYDETSALYYTLQKIDIPFIKEAYEYIKENKQININNYVNYIRKKENRKLFWKDFSSTDVLLSEINEKVRQEEEWNKKYSDLEEIWGVQDTEKDYAFLQDTFDKYTNGIEFVNPQQEDLYRDLCRDRLLLRKINDKRYDGEESIDKIQTRISKLMEKLKLDEFESNKPKTASEESLFAKIAQIEQTKPADLYKEPKKYADFNKLRKYEKDMVLRPLLNTLCGHKDFDINIDDIEQYNLDKGGDD